MQSMGPAMDVTKSQKLVQFRVPDALSGAIETAASKRFQSKSEYVRQALLAGLRADGFEPPAIHDRSAGALYDLVDGKRRYARIEAGTIDDVVYFAADPRTDPEQKGRTWLPVVHVDSEPFDLAQHFRLKPVFS